MRIQIARQQCLVLRICSVEILVYTVKSVVVLGPNAGLRNIGKKSYVKHFCIYLIIIYQSRPICYCPPDWLGDETIQCFNSLQGSEPAKPQSPADPSARPRPTPPKPSGSGIKCGSNTDCPPNMSCIKTTAANNARECFDPCSTLRCGFNAECKVENRRAFCNCKSGFYGDARIECSPEKLEKEPQFEPLIQQSVESQLNRRCNKPEVCGLRKLIKN
jgi:hypothetical protein